MTGKTAVITGGGSGIGAATARLLVARGDQVLLVGRTEDRLRATQRALEDEFGGGRAEILAIDIETDQAPATVVAAARERWGRIDTLVNNAGTSEVLGVGGAEDRWQHAYALRVVAPRQLAEALLPEMRARKFGRIINIGGTFEVQSIINSASVMNAARTVYSKSLSHEVAKDGITVNTVGPGVILSEQIDKIFPTREAREEYCNRTIPVGYFGEPRDLAALVAFLASPIARYITGEVIAVDGGSHRFAF